ncbi:MAG: hypothetical protein P8179_16830 [Candidatus Thiodiazotropha sp.]|jgi:chromosome segregation ATPase
MDDGFIDLRLNNHDGQGEDSFWPSFTDIMTVIVMIFMLAMVILLVRNMELLSQLRSTMEAEQQAMELVRSTDEENETLEERLIARENELTMMRMQMMQMRERSEEQEGAISNQRIQISKLNQERNRLNNQVDRLTQEGNRLQNRLNEANRNIKNLTSDLQQANTRQTETLNDLSQLQQSMASKDEELIQALTRNQERDAQITNLKKNYSDLKIQYNKLLRPARTAKGKTVIEVRYTKQGKSTRIQYKGPTDNAFTIMSRDKLEQKLTRMKQRHNKLYIKVIIPKQSGLSYNEAWSFTNHLHRNYDYYYQEEAQKERIIE